MFPAISVVKLLFTTIGVILTLRLLSRSSLWFFLKKSWRLLEDRFHVYQFYKVPQFNEYLQENQLYRKVLTYLTTLPCFEDSDINKLFSANKSNEISLVLDFNQTVMDTFLSARIYWTNHKCKRDGRRTLVLKIRRSDKRLVLRHYLQHIHSIFDEIELRRKEVRLYINVAAEPEKNGRWISVPFTHPSTIDTVLMDADLKNKVKSDLESFLKSKQYYHRVGRIWKRSYLLYGPSGTGKSSFVAGMAKLLCYDVYDIDLSKVQDDSDLKMLLLQTTNKSMILIEDLDRFLGGKSTAVSLSGVLNFMDGIVSCCGEERVMVFTMNSKNEIAPTVLRPGRIDVHIHFPPCNFSAFKTLANSHLGLRDHKLFPQVEEIFQAGARLSPAEISEIMISNRSSPSRALKSIITALQTSADGRREVPTGRRLNGSTSVRTGEESGETGISRRQSSHSMSEFRKLYGIFRTRNNGRRESTDMDSSDVDHSRHGVA